MCGIAGVHFKDPDNTGASAAQIETLVNKLLLGIEHRGKDATGMLTVNADGVPNLVKADTKASTFIDWREGVPSRPRTILLHTRLATQGSPTVLENNHPVQHGSVFATHNGHISNDSDLFASEEITRTAEVDSEIIPALFHKYGMDQMHDVLPLLDGGFAIAVVDPVAYPDRTLLAKGYSSPMFIWESKYAVIWASTELTISGALKEAFGFTPKINRIKSVSVGDIIILDKADVTLDEFNPFARKYKYSGYQGTTCDTGSTGRSWGGSWGDEEDENEDNGDRLPATVADFMAEECASCLCQRMYHGEGSDYDGKCSYIASNGFACRCVAFKIKTKPKPESRPASVTDKEEADVLGLDICDGCHREFWASNLIKVGNNRLCRYYCAKDPAVNGTAKALGLLNDKAKGKKDDSPGAAVKGKSMDHLALNVYGAMCEALQKGENTLDAREKLTNEYAAEITALKTGMNAAYVLWLVDEMTDEIMEGDSTGYLKAAMAEAGDVFFKAWNKIDMLVDDLVDDSYAAEDAELLDENITTEEAVIA